VGFLERVPLTTDFIPIILHMLAAGLQDFWIQEDQVKIKRNASRWMKENVDSEAEKILNGVLDRDREAKPIFLNSLVGLGILVFIGIVLSSVSCVLEMVLNFTGQVRLGLHPKII